MANRLLTVFSLIVIAFLSVQAVQGAYLLGRATDEHTHGVDRTRSWVNSGWFVPNRFLSNGEPKGSVSPGRLRAYGPAWGVTGHVVNTILGVEEWGKPSSRGTENRRLVSTALGVIAALAVAFAVGTMTTATAGLWTGAALMAIPAWTGYAMFHPKDVAVAAGFAMLSSGLAAALTRTRYWPVVVALCALGIFYGFGTRTAMWIPFFGLLLAFAFLTWMRGIGNRVAVAVGTLIGVAGVALIQPRHVADLHAFFVASARVSAEFPGARGRSTLTAGELLPAIGGPWWYLPAWAGTAIPLGIMALALLGLGLLVVRKSWGLDPLKRLTHAEAGAIFFALQALALPVASTVAGSNVYGGLRQHLYLVPGIAGLAGIGAAWVLAQRPGWLVPSCLAVALLVPTIEQTRLFPYNYTYRNLLAHPVEGRWETDINITSRREAMWMVPRDVPVSCITGEGNARNCFHTSERGRANVLPLDDGHWLIMRVFERLEPPAGCRDHGKVERPLRWETLTMIRVMICDSDPREK